MSMQALQALQAPGGSQAFAPNWAVWVQMCRTRLESAGKSSEQDARWKLSDAEALLLPACGVRRAACGVRRAACVVQVVGTQEAGLARVVYPDGDGQAVTTDESPQVQYGGWFGRICNSRNPGSLHG
jgi:hypothetical protein